MYIRTKNRIYEVESTLRDNGFVKGYTVGEMAFIRKDQVINQSENLEELCDEIVDENQHYILKNKNLLKDIPNKSALKNHKIYGAIWTKWGLKYVAKLNKKGKLELL